MIALRLNKDQTRLIEKEWLPYMIKSAWTHLRSNTGNHGKYLNCKIVITLLCKVQIIVQRKLISNPKKIKFNFSDDEAAALYVFLMRLPIDKGDVYKVLLRQQLCDH